MISWFLFLTILPILLCKESSNSLNKDQKTTSTNNLEKDKHGRIKMGEPVRFCDDGEHGIEVDWKNETDFEYTCQKDETIMSANFTAIPYHQCRTDGKRKVFPVHRCLDKRLEYDEDIPTWGNHRPLWPVYGRYLFLPCQRWLHSLEHRGTVFLYHPCVDPNEVQKLFNFVKSCFYRWVMTPNRHLTAEYPFAVVNFGCIYRMGYFDENSLKKYLQEHALKDGLEIVKKQGQYRFGLLKGSYPDDLELLKEEKICINDVISESDYLENVRS